MNNKPFPHWSTKTKKWHCKGTNAGGSAHATVGSPSRRERLLKIFHIFTSWQYRRQNLTTLELGFSFQIQRLHYGDTNFFLYH